MVSIDDDWTDAYGNVYDTYGNNVTNSNWSTIIAYQEGNTSTTEDITLNSSSNTYDFGGDGPTGASLRLINTSSGFGSPSDPIHIHLDSVSGPQMVVDINYSDSGGQHDLVFPYGTFSANTKFSCSISVPSTIPAGSSTNIDVTVTNNGGSGTQDIELVANGSLVGVQSATLNNGESTTLTYSYTADSEGTVTLEADISLPGSGGFYETNAYSSATTEAKTASFSVSVDSTNSPVLAGNTLDVTATISESNGVSGQKDVELSVGGSTRDTITVSLSGSGSKQKTFNWNTSSGDAGSHTAIVSSPDDSGSSSVTIEGPSASITITGTNSPITARNTLNVTADVANNGGSGTENVTLDVGGSQRDSTSLTLGINETVSQTLSWDTSDGDFGSYTATYASSSNSDTTSVSIEIPSPVNVTIDNSIEDKLTVDWDEVSEATGYYVYRAQSSGSSKTDYTQVADVSSPPYTDQNLEDGEQYYYRVSVYN